MVLHEELLVFNITFKSGETMNIILETHKLIEIAKIPDQPQNKIDSGETVSVFSSMPNLDYELNDFLLLILKEIKTIAHMDPDTNASYHGDGIFDIKIGTIHSVGSCIAISRIIHAILGLGYYGLNCDNKNSTELDCKVGNLYKDLICLWLEHNGVNPSNASILHPIRVEGEPPSMSYSESARYSNMYEGEYGKKRMELLDFAIGYLSNLQNPQ